NAVVSPRADVDQSGDAMIVSLVRGEEFIEQLITLSAAAEAAEGRLDEQLIGRTRPSSDDSLYNLLWRCAEIWNGLTGRPASVDKVASKSREDDRPDFLLFVCDVARMATGNEPTFKQVATAFRTPYRGEKSPE